MSSLTEQILRTIETLSAQDQREVLDFVEFLKAKHQHVRITENESFFESAQSLIGVGEGPGDLSTNPDYMHGYGQ